VALVAALTVLSFAGGGYGGVALGAATALIWLLLAALALTGSLEPMAVRSGALAAAACLAGLAAFTALSLGWASDDGAGFVDVVRVGGYLGVFVLVSLFVRPGEAGSVLSAIAIVGVGVAAAAIASRLLDLGPGDAGLAAAQPAASGRLSYPIGYWNGLGAIGAMTVPLLIWLASRVDARWTARASLAAVPLALLAIYMTSSRGAMLAALVSASVVIALGREGRRAFLALLVGVVAALPAIVAASLGEGILTSPGTGVGTVELVVLASLAVPTALAFAAGPRLLRFAADRDRGRVEIRGRHVLVVGLVAGLAVVLAAGPSALVGDFREGSGSERIASGAGIFSTSGSGRAQFWDAAADAFAEEPARGIGAGGYASYWSRNGTLSTPVRNAHSEPLELAAELGAPGLLLFAGFFAIAIACGIRRIRGPDRDVATAALALLIAGLIGVCVDWTWDLPAVVVPILIAAALLVGPALARPGRPEAEAETRPRRGSGARTVAGPIPVLTLVAAAVAFAWAGGVLMITSAALDSSEEALRRGDLPRAAAKARSAAAVEPWASEPWVQLASVEFAAGNSEAARIAIAAAIERAPDDFRNWVLAAEIAAKAGRSQASGIYTLRALELAPELFGRAVFTDT